jgi:hypothetical protein
MVVSVPTFSCRSETRLGNVSVPDIQATATIFLRSVKGRRKWQIRK